MLKRWSIVLVGLCLACGKTDVEKFCAPPGVEGDVWAEQVREIERGVPAYGGDLAWHWCEMETSTTGWDEVFHTDGFPLVKILTGRYSIDSKGGLYAHTAVATWVSNTPEQAEENFSTWNCEVFFNGPDTPGAIDIPGYWTGLCPGLEKVDATRCGTATASHEVTLQFNLTFVAVKSTTCVKVHDGWHDASGYRYIQWPSGALPRPADIWNWQAAERRFRDRLIAAGFVNQEYQKVTCYPYRVIRDGMFNKQWCATEPAPDTVKHPKPWEPAPEGATSPDGGGIVLPTGSTPGDGASTGGDYP